MKKLFNYSFLLFIILSISFHARAQPEDQGKWSVGIVFSPDYASRHIKFPDEHADWKEYLDENEQPIFGYTTGISFLYSLNKKFELESGLMFSSKGFKYTAPEFVVFDENDSALPLEATTTYNYRYLDVPFKMNWFFLQKKVKLFLSAGVAGSFFLDELMVQELKFPDRTERSQYNEKDVDFNPVVLSLTGGAGIKYSLSDRLHIRLNPEFRRAVTPLADMLGEYYLWSAGVNSGVFFKLQR